ncbi:hypothetical protein ACERIM_16570 [Natrinema sp. H-ect1]|uniref:hypothetical protein n=1 Tax=Natrinema sp. H-ect1 TaxID=3242700 RepID=UPI00359DE212
MIESRMLAIALILVAASGAAIGPAAGTGTDESNTSTATTIPDDGPAYGVNETRFPLLWSEDVEQDTRSSDEFVDNVSSDAAFASRLAGSTDVPFEKPIADVSIWNSGDLRDFSPGDETTSTHPEGARLEDGLYVRDAYTSIFAIQPSTVLQSGNATTQYIASEGEVLAISDYRVRVPDDDTTGSIRDQWSLAETTIDSVELRADGRLLDTDSGHRSSLEYSDLSGAPNLTVAVEIAVRLRHETRTCEDYNSTADSCEGSWETETEDVTEGMTVTASRHTVVNRVDDSGGKRVTFESDSNRTGIVVHPNATWSSIDIDGNGRLRGPWRFYSAGVDGWHTMVSRTATSTTRRNSSVRPAQTHAVPVQKRPDIPSESTGVETPLAIEETWGDEQAGPSLSSEIAITPADRYLQATSVAARSKTLPNTAFEEVTVHGIVHGQSRTISIDDRGTVRETTLELTVLEANSSGAVVEATVTESTTGEPVTTGRVEVGNQSVPVNASGIAVLELEDRPSLLVDGRYVPADWWRTDQLYAEAEDRAKIPPKYPTFQKLVQLVLVTLLWFLPVAVAVYGFDYLTGGAALGLRNRQ